MKILDRKELKIFLTFFLIYCYFSKWDGWSEDSEFALIRAIVEENRFEIDSFANYTGDRFVQGKHYYTSKSPGEPFLAVPIYATFNSIYSALPSNFTDQYREDNIIEKYYIDIPYKGKAEFFYEPNPGALILISMILSTALTSSLFSAMSTVLIYKISKHFTKEEKIRLSLTIAYGLATLIFPNALVFTGSGTSTFFVFLSFFLLFEIKNAKTNINKYSIISGILLGFGVSIRPELILIAGLFFIYLLLIKKEKILLFLIGVLIGIMPNLIYNNILFSSDILSLKYDPTIWYKGGAEGISTDFSIKSVWLDYYGYYAAQNPLWMLFWLLPYKGVFFYHPIFSFCLISFYFMYKNFKKESILFILIFCILIIFSSSFWLYKIPLPASFGMKYLTASSPFLIIPFIYFIQKFGLKVAWIIIALGVFINFLGLQDYTRPSTYGYTELWETNPEFRKKISSFEINPLLDYYFPLFLKNGPCSPIFGGAISGTIPDIRRTEFNYEPITIFSFNGQEVKLVTKFLCLVPIFILVLLIWKKEFLGLIKAKIKWMDGKILFIVSLIIFLILFIRIY